MIWDDFRLSKRLDFEKSVIEKIYALIAEIDAVKNSWVVTKKLLPQTIEQLSHSVIITSTGASNRIEGNTLTDDQVEKIYKNLRIKKFKTRDEQEVVGYLECLQFIFDHYNEIEITESSILKLHHDMLLASERDDHHRGKYKIGSNRVEAKDQSGNIIGVIFDPTPPYLVSKEMQELIAWYNWSIKSKDKHPLIIIANFIFEYLAIHPFQDGNGRTSRLITNLMLLQQNYQFVTLASHERIIEEYKTNYYQALNQTQKTWKTKSENINSWLIFFLNVLKIQGEKALSFVEAETIDHLLSEKQLALWKWIQNNKLEFSRKDAIAALNFPARTIEESIKKLVELKRIEKLGRGKGTRYRIISDQ